MEQRLKERLVGAAVLVILAVIFIPMLLDDSVDNDIVITKTNIPPVPETIPTPPDDGDFSSRIIPLEPATPAKEGGDSVEPRENPPVIENLAEQETDTEMPEKTVPKTGAGDEEMLNDVGLSAWVVQLGSFSSKENAESLNKKLRSNGYRSFVEPLKMKDSTVYRVRVGPELKREDADSIKDKLNQSLDLKGIVVEYP